MGLCRYYAALDAASPHLGVQHVGRSTDGREMILLVIGEFAPAALAEVQARQRELVSGSPGDASANASPTTQPVVAFIQGTLHSTEVAASMMLPSLVHWLITSEEEIARRIRAEVVLLIMPSANPDGLDLVHDWNLETIGTRHEGTSPPTLYQHYAGHDNNRDWFMLSLAETRVISRVLYEEWFPEVVLDIHQMGSHGARMFVPPCSDPLNVNVPALISREIDLVGAHMAMALQEAGLQGVVQDVVYDNYWAGGARNTPCRHNMAGIITETAAARLAHNIEIEAGKLRGHGVGLPEYKRQGNFPDPWPGGRWTLADAVRYQRVSTVAMLDLLAQRRERFVKNFATLNENCRDHVPDGGPAAFAIPSSGDRGALARLAENLRRTGITIQQTTTACALEGHELPSGSLVVRMDQAFRAHAKDVLEVQRYPELKSAPDGEVLRPYDTAGWSLPLQFGLHCHELKALPDASAPLATVEQWPESARVHGSGRLARFACDTNSAFTLANRLRHSVVPVVRLEDGSFLCEAAGETLTKALAGLHLDVQRVEEIAHPAWDSMPRPRVGIFQSWPASMDGGWTRLVLDEHGYEPRMVETREILAGALDELDALILPDVSASTLDDGPDAARLPERWQGGLKGKGAELLKRFVERGGRLAALGTAALWTARSMDLGVVNGLQGAPLKGKDAFSCPGSLLGVSTSGAESGPARGVSARLARAARDVSCVFFEGSATLAPAVNEAAIPGPLKPVLSFNGELASGWIARAELLRGHAALMAGSVGSGEVALFAMRPQHRSQTLGTFRLLFEFIERR